MQFYIGEFRFSAISMHVFRCFLKFFSNKIEKFWFLHYFLLDFENLLGKDQNFLSEQGHNKAE